MHRHTGCILFLALIAAGLSAQRSGSPGIPLPEHPRPEFERAGNRQRLVVRVDDTPHPFKLEGKQGYGPARGMWQTVYLEARGSDPVDAVRFTPRRDLAGVAVDVRLLEPAPRDLTLRLSFT